jgi:curved DNA-binding protein CbpA
MTAEEFADWAKALEGKSYYEILSVPLGGDEATVKEAFHSFAIACHPDNFSEDPELAAAGASVFKRAVEAYQVLSRAELRTKYDEGLIRGRKRLDERHISAPPPPMAQRTNEMIATTKRGKAFAAKADRLIAIGKLEEARLQLVSACQDDPNNEELAERVQILWEALALEPL